MLGATAAVAHQVRDLAPVIAAAAELGALALDVGSLQGVNFYHSPQVTWAAP